MDQVIIPSPRSTDGFVELARTGEYRGHRWRKHILNLGTLIHPQTGARIPLDDGFYDRLKRNFEAGICDTVAVPLADDQNRHSEDPLRNSGEVMGVSRDGNKVYVDLDIRDPKVHQGLKNGTLLGTSAFLSMDYKDTRTGQRVGPALLHACITNRPYVTGLEPYQEVVAATADSDSDVLMLTPEEPGMTKEELLAALRDEHGIDVEQLQQAASHQAEVGQLTAALTSALSGSGALALSDDQGAITLSDVVQAVAELASDKVELSSAVAQLQRDKAETEVEGYIRQGRVLPKQRAAYVELALSNRAMLDSLLPVEPLIKLNDPQGAAPPDGEGAHSEDIDREIERLGGVAASMAGRNRR